MVSELVSTEDLQFSVDFETSKITIANEDKLLKIANLYASRYADIVVSPETEKDVKKIRAEMKKVVKATDDKRKEIKREYNKPLVEFEQKVKAINAVINNVIDPIDKGLKELEKVEREKRRDEVIAIVEETAKAYDVNPESVEIKAAWLNKSISVLQKTKEISFDVKLISDAKQRLEQDISSIESYSKAVNIESFGWIEQVKQGANVADVMNRINLAVKAKKEQQIKKQAQEEAKSAIEALQVETVNNTNVNVETGEIMPDSINTYLITIESTQKDFAAVTRILYESGLDFKIKEVNK
ncbi:DUF1351 domain-containing protein [Dellaglioa algida]|uniref:DUF1351 domain-containing protein n=1 Tax=Dellaglioa algida TaxID=105612 RepID=A0A5C6M676_9LACO|nr:DUF1351 domain-containing protein [Dellaglioa algida]MDK1720197.1 DUF1351 domain-containing protein [Dellaglioa algida]MDK1723587.1 DUF1351 domain-containing protein [Dellaglioa algida]TWW10128.1 hypothetical protein LABALGLTS371_16100 [Dellaglioa algida]